jgi:hypothetical protein
VLKKIGVVILGLMFYLAGTSVAKAAFPSEDYQTLDQKAVVALTDDGLKEKYIDALVEIEASKAFHSTSGFTPNAYSKYKELLKYRLLLLFEIYKRKLEIPPSVQ